jgi:hypothetical protein
MKASLRGRGWARSQIIQPLESIVLNKKIIQYSLMRRLELHLTHVIPRALVRGRLGPPSRRPPPSLTGRGRRARPTRASICLADITGRHLRSGTCWTFCHRTFCNWTFCNWTFCNWTFCNWTFCNWTFCNWTFCNWTFCNWTFCNWTFCNWMVCNWTFCNWTFCNWTFSN